MKEKFFDSLIALVFCFSLISIFFVTAAQAETTDTVSATVTAEVFSVSVSDGSISFGSVAQNSTEDTSSNGINDSQTASNDGTVAAKLNIRAADSTGGTGWTLAGTAGSETYTMKFCVTDCDGSPTWNTVGISPSYATLATSVSAAGTQVFDMQVGTPTSTVETTEQAITITVQAVEPD